MPTKNIELGRLVLTDENGKEFEIGQLSDLDVEIKSEYQQTKLNFDLSDIKMKIKIPFKSRLKFKWELWKCKRRIKKLINAICEKGKAYEFTYSFVKEPRTPKEGADK